MLSVDNWSLEKERERERERESFFPKLAQFIILLVSFDSIDHNNSNTTNFYRSKMNSTRLSEPFQSRITTRDLQSMNGKAFKEKKNSFFALIYFRLNIVNMKDIYRIDLILSKSFFLFQLVFFLVEILFFISIHVDRSIDRTIDNFSLDVFARFLN